MMIVEGVLLIMEMKNGEERGKGKKSRRAAKGREREG